MENKLEEQLGICINILPEALQTTGQKAYVEALQKLIPCVQNASGEQIDMLPFAQNIKMSFATDQMLMKETVQEERDRVSLLSTLVTYIACRQEGMPEHSREYMDRVSGLRKMIDDYYGEKSQQFCGS